MTADITSINIPATAYTNFLSCFASSSFLLFISLRSGLLADIELFCDFPRMDDAVSSFTLAFWFLRLTTVTPHKDYLNRFFYAMQYT